MKKRFENKHVLVTGGARGIGLEIALQFISEGATVSVFDINLSDINLFNEKAKDNQFQAIAYQVDIAQKSKVETEVIKLDTQKPIDILINNAGIAKDTPFLEIDEAEWNKILQVNLTGMFLVSQSVCKKMAERKKGVVVNMASKNGLDGEAGYAHYNASKGGVIMLTKTMALELAKYNIRVNAVCPGYISTPMSMEIDSPEFVKNFTDRYIPMDRTGLVSEIAPAFLFLASDESSFMTGQHIVIDGGQLAGQKPS
jgi:3-oxoacyl-[acyl-carrier protein] reductase